MKKHYLIIFLLISLIPYTVFQQKEDNETEDDLEDNGDHLQEDLKSVMNELKYGEEEEITKVEFSRILTKYFMRGTSSSDFDFVKIVDKIVIKILVTVPERVKVAEMSKYLSTELITEIFTDLLEREYDLKSMMKDSDL